ncbi:MAG: helix-turn-helix transcriptional regulator [Bacteroidetes bacterium]|nr:helix-turn-helix transcriptional regulator [Bacteroidota bacterium]
MRKYRRIMGYSQKDVADMLGFTGTSKISRWEKGERMPSVKNLLKLSVIYATLPNDLYYDLWQDVKKNIRKKESSK